MTPSPGCCQGPLVLYRKQSTRNLTQPTYPKSPSLKMKNVSCEYDRWVVETQLCKLRDTSDTLIGRACAMFHLQYEVLWCLWITSAIYMVADTQFHKFYGRPFARVLHLFIVKDIGRWLPWVLPGSTGRFYKDDFAHNHSAHGYHTTRLEGEVWTSKLEKFRYDNNRRKSDKR